MANKSFYEKGIRFECQGTGKCCTSRGEYGFVYLTLQDRKRFALFFKLSLSDFTKAYCEKKDGHYHLKNLSDDCLFLKDAKCTTYEARPEQCRTWPFWPEVLNTKTWNAEVVGYCAGVGKGKLYSAKEIEDILKSQKE